MLKGIIDLDSGNPPGLSEQIYRQIRLAVRDGRLTEGQKLPSSRALAKLLGVSRNTVCSAYDLLKAELIISVRTGAAPRIVRHAPIKAQTMSRRLMPRKVSLSRRGRQICENPREGYRVNEGGMLESGIPALDVFPRDAWARSLRKSSRSLTAADVHYRNIAGLPDLRQQLAVYLAEARGVVGDPEQILIVTSTQGSLAILSRCLADQGDRVLTEEPGYLGARGAFTSNGLDVKAMHVDNEGAVPPSAEKPFNSKLIYLTPSHQFPLGHVMSLSRRLAFIEYARANASLILEDDYDSEFLFGDRPIASLQGLALGSEVVYLGTFAKTMLPGIRLAYMVVPDTLSDKLTQAIRNTGIMASVPVQAAMADFIATGQYRAHLKKIRFIYQSRGAALCAALRQRFGDHSDIGLPSGGVQLVMIFKQLLDDVQIATELQAAGVGVSALSLTYLKPKCAGLIIGFSGADEKTIRSGLRVMNQVFGRHAVGS